MAKPITSFEDYINNNQRSSSSSSGGKFHPAPAPTFEGNDPSGPPQSPLNWLMDIISRPLFGVTNVINKGVDRGVEARKSFESGDVAGGIGNSLKEALAPVDFLSGLFGTDHANQKYTGQTIEHVTDKVGSLDPNYKDVQDNVNPWVKGVAGFVGDVALDPITYIPGGLVIKGLKGANNVAKDVFHAGGEAGQVARDAERAAGKVADANRHLVKTASKEKLSVADYLTKYPDRAPVGGDSQALKLIKDLPEATGKKAQKAQKADIEKIIKAEEKGKLVAPKTPVVTTLGTLPEAMPPSLENQLLNSTRKPTVEKLFDNLDKDVKKSAKIPDVAPALQPLKKSEWMDEAVRVGKPTDELAVGKPFVDASELKNEYFKSNPAIAGSGYLDAEQALNIIRSDKAPLPAKAELGNVLEQKYAAYTEAFDAAATKGNRLDVNGNELPNLPQSSFKVSDSLAAFSDRMARNEEGVSTALGSQLTAYLKAKKSPARFAESIEHIRRALQGNSDLAEIVGRKDSNVEKAAVSALLRSVGIDVKHTLAAREGVDSLDQTQQVLALARGEVPEETLKYAEEFQKVFHEAIIADDARYPFESAKGVAQTEEGIGAGLGRHFRQLNMMSTYTENKHFRSLALDSIKKKVRNADGTFRTSGPQYAAMSKEATMPMMRARDMLKAQEGIPSVIGVGENYKIMYWSQIVDTLSTKFPEAMAPVLWNHDTLIPETNLMQAILMKLNGADDVTTLSMLLNEKKFGDKGNLLNQTFDNPMAKGGRYGHQIKKSNVPLPEGVSYAAGKTSGVDVVYSAEKLSTDLLEAINRSVGDLAEVASKNAEVFRDRIVAETGELTDAAVKDLEALIGDSSRIVEGLDKFANIPVDIKDYANLYKTTDGAQAATTEIVDGIVEGARVVNAKGAKAVISATTKAVKKSNKKPAVQVEEGFEAGKAIDQSVATKTMEADEAMAKEALGLPPDAYGDLAGRELAYGGVSANRWRMLDPLQRMFNAKWGAPDIFNLTHSMGNVNAVYIAGAYRELSRLSKQFDRETMGNAFKSLQNGAKAGDPQVMAASEGLGHLLDNLWSTTNDFTMGSSFFRTNKSLSLMNEAMGDLKMTQVFDLDDAARLAKINGTSMLDEAAKQWRNWVVEDPATFVSQMYLASVKLSTDQAVSQSFMRLATNKGWTSKVMKPGFVKMTSTGRSTYMKHLPDDIYVDKKIFDQIHYLDVASRSSRQLDGELGKFINDYFDPIQNAWKYAITLPRPGHHIRNLTGDSSLTFVAEGLHKYPQSAKAAFKVLALHNKYEGVDIGRALQKFGDFDVPHSGETISTGHFGDISAEDFWVFAHEGGIMPTYRMNEDFLLEDVAGSNRLSKVMDKLTLRHGKTEEFLGGISEYRDHYSRLQHLMQFVMKQQEKPTFATKKEMLTYATTRVKQFHPDASMLSEFEAKYLRRIIPFYTWFRGVMPAIVESTFAHTGRVTAFPKASFNLATAMGVNPDSLADPFPSDQLFPSFLTEQATGPIFGSASAGYFGINPGIAHLDVFNMLGPDPVRGILGMTSPLLRMPVELATGGSMSTGAEINDNSDYIDQSIPGVNYIANITGNSVTGSVASLLQGKGFDPQLQVARGNKGPVDKAATIVNWLTGVGLENESRPNYIKFAEIEKRNNAGKDKKNAF